MPKYCKKCGYVFGEGRILKLVEKGICPICKSKLYETKESISYFQGRIEKSMPTWEDVVRHKYLKNVKLDNNSSLQRSKKEKERQEYEINKLKNNYIQNNSTKPIVKCPYCNSINTKKITNTSKAVHTILFGIFSVSRNSKQWHCNNCGSEW